MTLQTKLKQNTYQLLLLILGSLSSVFVSIWVTYIAVENNELSGYNLFLAPFLQTLNFLGAHFVFSFIYRSIPWRKIAPIILVIETTIIFIPYFVECAILFYIHRFYNYDISLSIFASNPQEAWEFVTSLGFRLLLMIPIALLCLFTTFLFAFKLLGKYKNHRSLRWLLHPSSSLIIVSVFIWSCIALQQTYRVLTGGIEVSPRYSTSADRLYWITYAVIRDRKNLSQHLLEMKSPDHFKGLTYQPTVDAPLKVVVILGESARADLMSAYGYERPTTPWLDSISKKGVDVVLFNDVCSSGPNTITSSQRIFTFWNNTPNKAWYHYPDLTNVLVHSGFYTQWITSQNTINMFSIERLLANSAHKLYKTVYASHNNIKDSSLSAMAYDDALLPALHRYDSQFLDNVIKKNVFTVIHLMGSHQNYSERYPSDFDYFKAKDMKECLTDDAKRQKAAYLNSLRYTDHLLEKMIQHYSSQRAVVFYFSDHGEMIDEPQQPGYFGHGTNVDHPTIDIPFFVYASPQLRKEHPELWERIKKAQFRPISTAWFTNSLTSLLGIHTKYNDERYNFFSDKFANPTRIAVQGDERHEVPPLKHKRVKG